MHDACHAKPGGEADFAPKAGPDRPAAVQQRPGQSLAAACWSGCRGRVAVVCFVGRRAEPAAVARWRHPRSPAHVAGGWLVFAAAASSPPTRRGPNQRTANGACARGRPPPHYNGRSLCASTNTSVVPGRGWRVSESARQRRRPVVRPDGGQERIRSPVVLGSPWIWPATATHRRRLTSQRQSPSINGPICSTDSATSPRRRFCCIAVCRSSL